MKYKMLRGPAVDRKLEPRVPRDIFASSKAYLLSR
jgi:hypothetical protein